MENEYKFFAGHRTFGPDVVGGKNPEFFYSKALENGFNVLGIDIFSFFGDDHVFLAAGELQMTRLVEAAEVASQEPPVDDGFRREFRFIQITRHNGFAANGNFANTVGSRIHDADFDPGQRLANGVRAKRFQVVDRDCGAGLPYSG